MPCNKLSLEKPQLGHKISIEGTNEKAGTNQHVSTPHSAEPMPKLLPPHLVFKPSKKLQPRILRKHRKQMLRIDRKPCLSPIADVVDEAADAPFEEPSLDQFTATNPSAVNAWASVSHKPSTVGSASAYSTQSGEERQHVISPSFGQASLGPSGLENPMVHPSPSISHKASNVSSIYSSQSGEERNFGPQSIFVVRDQHQ
jgi:hypothetical protein